MLDMTAGLANPSHRGLNTVNLSELNTWQQIMLFALIFVGSAIFVSNFVLQVRRRKIVGSRLITSSGSLLSDRRA